MNVKTSAEQFEGLLKPVREFIRDTGAGSSGWLQPNIRVNPMYNSGAIMNEQNSGSVVNGGSGQQPPSRYLAVTSRSNKSPAGEQTQQQTFNAGGLISRQAVGGMLITIGAVTVFLWLARGFRRA